MSDILAITFPHLGLPPVRLTLPSKALLYNFFGISNAQIVDELNALIPLTQLLTNQGNAWLSVLPLLNIHRTCATKAALLIYLLGGLNIFNLKTESLFRTANIWFVLMQSDAGTHVSRWQNAENDIYDQLGTVTM